MLGVSLVPLNVLALPDVLALLNVLALPVPLNALALPDVLLLYYQFAALAVVLENTSQDLSLDSVANDMGKYQFLVWAAFSHLAELVRDGCPPLFDHLG